MISGPTDVTLNCAWQVGIMNLDGQMLVLLRLRLGGDRETVLMLGLEDAEKIATALVETSAATRRERVTAARALVGRLGIETMAEPQGSA